jgi:hypothetical protein
VISFRYHVVSIVAVFLALALGVVVGTTALNGPITTDLRNKVDALNKQRDTNTQQTEILQQQVNNGNQFANTYGARVVNGALAGQKVIMIAMPSASSAIKDGVAKQIANAGGTISGKIQLTGDHPIGLTLPVTDDAGRLAGALLAFVLSGEGQPSDITQVLTALATAQMLKVDGNDVTSAKVIVVVASGTMPAADVGAQNQLQLVTQLQLAGCHTLVAGDTPAATAGGLIALVRGSDADKSTVSTVDDADTVVGQVTSVLALAEVAGGKNGAYGTGGGAQALFPSLPK